MMTFGCLRAEGTHITRQLRCLQDGGEDAMNALMPLVYDELKKLARSHLRREINAAPLQTTALVHEAFLKLAGSRHPSYENRAHFYGIASRVMRQVLVDAARAKMAEKRAAAEEVPLTDVPDWNRQPDRSVLALEDALQLLERTDPQKGQLIEMRYFGGLTAEESSTALSIPVHKVRRDLRLAQAWLRREMTVQNTGHAGGRSSRKPIPATTMAQIRTSEAVIG
jgi:RNA polymerase sigma factor (TIGR02999 family)